jgi:hypothetical protein
MSRIVFAAVFIGSIAASVPALAQYVPAQYGGPGPGYGREWEGRREHCWRLRDRYREVRERVRHAPPWEQDRLGHRAYELRERLRQECWGHWRDGD